MAILTTGNTFSTGQQVTATSLNAAVNGSSFLDGAIDPATMQFFQTSPKEQIGIKDLGVTAAKIANLTVTGAKIADATIAPAKLSAGAPAWTATTLNVANSLDFALANSTATAGTYGRAVTTGLITVTMNGHGMVTGNVALLDFSDNGSGSSGTDGSYVITRIDDNSFTVVDTAASPTEIAAGTVVSRTNYYGNATIRGSATVAGTLSLTGSPSNLTIGSAQVATPSGSAPLFMARAFVSFDSTRNSSGGTDSLNTARFIYGGKNVTSVTKIASGQFRVAITTAMPNTNYCVVCNTSIAAAPRWAGVDPLSLTTTQFDIYTDTQDSVSINQPYISAVVFG